MQSRLQYPFSRPVSNEILHDLQFLLATALKPAGIVKNVTVMIGEHEFILDGVLATLAQG